MSSQPGDLVYQAGIKMQAGEITKAEFDAVYEASKVPATQSDQEYLPVCPECGISFTLCPHRPATPSDDQAVAESVRATEEGIAELDAGHSMTLEELQNMGPQPPSKLEPISDVVLDNAYWNDQHVWPRNANESHRRVADAQLAADQKKHAHDMELLIASYETRLSVAYTSVKDGEQKHTEAIKFVKAERDGYYAEMGMALDQRDKALKEVGQLEIGIKNITGSHRATNDALTEAQAELKASNEAREALVTALEGLAITGDWWRAKGELSKQTCFCGMAIGNPMLSDHTETCKRATDALATQPAADPAQGDSTKP